MRKTRPGRSGIGVAGIEVGLRKCRVDLLRTLMLKKFRTVPKWADAKLEAASESDLVRGFSVVHRSAN